jgi:hypothetical protein
MFSFDGAMDVVASSNAQKSWRSSACPLHFALRLTPLLARHRHKIRAQ